jgi:4-hydroxybenzoate polyprenyltransferase/phosphoglycolate phosphatase-like HAD superfamily hydrolase
LGSQLIYKPIAVDLDGTLIHTDTLHESCLKLFHHHPAQILLLLFWLVRGKAYLKTKLSERITLDFDSLPYNLELIDWLKEQKALGHQLILCTASDIKVANSIAQYLDLFDEVIATDGQTNLAGKYKREALLNRFGQHGFIYVGNSNADLEVWQSSSKAVVVNAHSNLIKKAHKLTEVANIFPSPPITLDSWRRVFRVHQYLKNLLLFLPLVAAHQVLQLQSLALLILAFVSFCLCASSVYITNDLMDLESDRQHPRKRKRPFASGVVPIHYGVIMALIILIISFLLAHAVGSHFFGWLLVYFLITVAYSLRLKRFLLIDCIALATLYTLRIIAGGAAIDMPLSFWLLAFSIFLFLSLAFIKRYAELEVQIQQGNVKVHGRAYHVSDAPLIQTLGISAGYASVLLLALYLNSETIIRLYATPEIIWLAVPLMMFWVSWMWMKAHRGEMHDDPIVFSIKDKTSLAVVILLAITFTVASLLVVV